MRAAMTPASGRAERARTLTAVTLLGFASGLPLALSASTLEAWCAVSGVSLKTIGVLKLVAFAYVFKFLWAPLVDRIAPPSLGRRRGWVLTMQAAIIAVLIVTAGLSPANSLSAIAGLAMLRAAFSATQDIAIDAYRADQLLPQDRGIGAALGVAGYRIAMVVSGGLALVLAGAFGFPSTYLVMAALMGIGIIGVAIAPERGIASQPKTLADAYWQPLGELLSRNRAGFWIALILLYKLGNAFALSLSSTFLLRGAEYTLAEVGWVNKVFGLAATIVGAFAGGLLLERWTLWRALWIFGLLQGSAALILAVAAENLTSGLGTGAFVALLMGLCDRRFSATQYALFSALDSAARVFVGPVAGYVAADFGWTAYFLTSVVCAVPGLWLLYVLRPEFIRFDQVRPDASA
jgi:PAT family beta-lactamase induction signal transducer AmpG